MRNLQGKDIFNLLRLFIFLAVVSVQVVTVGLQLTSRTTVGCAEQVGVNSRLLTIEHDKKTDF